MTTMDEAILVRSLGREMDAAVARLRDGERAAADEYFALRDRRDELIERLEADGIDWESLLGRMERAMAAIGGRAR